LPASRASFEVNPAPTAEHAGRGRRSKRASPRGGGRCWSCDPSTPATARFSVFEVNTKSERASSRLIGPNGAPADDAERVISADRHLARLDKKDAADVVATPPHKIVSSHRQGAENRRLVSADLGRRQFEMGDFMRGTRPLAERRMSGWRTGLQRLRSVAI